MTKARAARAWAAVAALCVALVCGPPGRDGKITTVGPGLEKELATETAGMRVSVFVPIFKDCEKEQLFGPSDHGISDLFFENKLPWIGQGESTCDLWQNFHIGALHSESFGHLVWQAGTKPKPKFHANYCEGAPATVSESPWDGHGNAAVLVGRTLKTRDTKFHEVNVRLLRLRRDIGHVFLRLSGANISVGIGPNRIGLLRYGFSLLPHLIKLPAYGFRLGFEILDLSRLSVSLPFGLSSELGNIADGAFQIARVASDTIGGGGDNQHSDADDTIYNINNPDFFPKRLVGWGLIVSGGSMIGMGWLWGLAASRRGLTVRQGGWRGGIAFMFLLFGILIVWQSVPLAFAI